MNVKNKMDEFYRSRTRKEYLVWFFIFGLIIAGYVWSEYYRHSGDWENEIVEGTVIEIRSVESESVIFALYIDIGSQTIQIFENYQPEVVVGEKVKVRKTSDEDGNRNHYFRLRKPRA